MSRDDDYRRTMSNAYLDRRQDRLDLMRSQERRTRAVYEGLRTGDDIKARSALGVPPAAASRSGTTPDRGAAPSMVEEVFRRSAGVLEEIDALAHFSEEQRRELRLRFELIDLWQRTADDEIVAFESLVRARAAELAEIADRLRSEIDLSDLSGSSAAATRLLGPGLARHDWSCLLFGSGFGGIADRLGMLSFLSEATRQRWVAHLRRIARANTNARFGLRSPAGTRDLANAAATLHAEIDSARRCVGLMAGIALLRGACRRYRTSLWA